MHGETLVLNFYCCVGSLQWEGEVICKAHDCSKQDSQLSQDYHINIKCKNQKSQLNLGSCDFVRNELQAKNRINAADDCKEEEELGDNLHPTSNSSHAWWNSCFEFLLLCGVIAMRRRSDLQSSWLFKTGQPAKSRLSHQHQVQEESKNHSWIHTGSGDVARNYL